MLALYRRILRSYPTAYYHEFVDEMTYAFRRAQIDAYRQGFAPSILFFAREIRGVLIGAVVERWRCQDWNLFRSFDMCPQFRFPRSTVVLMLVILAGVVLAIEQAKGVQVKYGANAQMMSSWTALPGFLLFAGVLVCLAAVSGWAILFALRRTGMHRISNL